VNLKTPNKKKKSFEEEKPQVKNNEDHEKKMKDL